MLYIALRYWTKEKRIKNLLFSCINHRDNVTQPRISLRVEEMSKKVWWMNRRKKGRKYGKILPFLLRTIRIRMCITFGFIRIPHDNLNTAWIVSRAWTNRARLSHDPHLRPLRFPFAGLIVTYHTLMHRRERERFAHDHLDTGQGQNPFRKVGGENNKQMQYILIHGGMD